MQPLPTKISLRKKRAREGRSGDEIEHFPIPSRVTVRKRAVAATIEQRDSGVMIWNHTYEFSFFKLCCLFLYYLRLNNGFRLFQIQGETIQGWKGLRMRMALEDYRGLL